MKPALLLVCDPVVGKAAAVLDAMTLWLADTRGAATQQATGPSWAVCVVPPPVHEPRCGAHILNTPTDMLVWAGEMFIPAHWNEGRRATELDDISRAVLYQLRTYGIDTLAQIDGGFVGAWFDRLADRWIVFNDKMGQIPIFWGMQGSRLVVSPRAALTARAIGAPLQISRAGVADLLRTQNMTEDHTLIEGVYWVQRGHALSVGPEGAGTCPCWDFDYTAPQIESADEAADLYVHALEGALRKHTSCTSELILGVSGGLDSRLYLALCDRLGRVPECFTSGWPFYEDVRFGRKLARVAGASHTLVPLGEELLPERLEQLIVQTDGLQSAAHLAPILPINSYLRDHAGGVLLEGFFNGLVGGCAVPAEEDAEQHHRPHQSHWARTTLHSGGTFERIRELLLPEMADDSEQEWSHRIDRIFRGAPADNAVSRAEYTMVHGRTGRVDVLGTGLLRRDVLVRNPASDSVMLDWHQRVSPRLRRGRACYIDALRRHFPRYARVPRADGCGALPIATDPWLREYCWQADRIHRWFSRARHPVARRFGTTSGALRMWTCDVWQRSGRLDILRDPSARVLGWVRRERLLATWEEARHSLAAATTLLTLGTLEVMCRELEDQAGTVWTREISEINPKHRPARRRPPCESSVVQVS